MEGRKEGAEEGREEGAMRGEIQDLFLPHSQVPIHLKQPDLVSGNTIFGIFNKHD